MTAEVAGAGVRVKLFGSSTRDALRSGDIDLLIELPEPTPDKLSVSLRAGARLTSLAETVLAEAALLRITDGRVFAVPMDAERAGTWLYRYSKHRCAVGAP